MEAENYLASGYGIRLAFEARNDCWAPLGTVAKIWQPSRLKGIQVGALHGTPFLAATQVFDLRPVPRKFLAVDQIRDANALFVKDGTVLVSRSGTVGRATVSYRAHTGRLISDDLLRVEFPDESWFGWIYAYLRSAQARSMMTASRYGHIIKHLEVSHLQAIPIPVLREDLRARFQKQAAAVLEDRSRAFDLTTEAESRLSNHFGLFCSSSAAPWFAASAASLFSRRRRLDASCHLPSVRDIIAAFKRGAREVVPLSSLALRVFVPGRFKHVYGEGGTPYLDSAEILEVNPDVAKRVLSLTREEQKDYRVESDWLLMPCSGQVYGNIGHTILATAWHTGKVLSNHILRICPSDKVSPGYLQCVLGHPHLGRPQLVRFAFGSSVPEIAPEDVATVLVPRLGERLAGR